MWYLHLYWRYIVQEPGIGYFGAYPISIETVPLLHYHPSGKFLQVSVQDVIFSALGVWLACWLQVNLLPPSSLTSGRALLAG